MNNFSYTFSLIVDPGIDGVCCSLRVAEVQAPALTLEVGSVGGDKGLLHGEALLAEHGVGNGYNVLVGLGRQGLVKLPQHLVRAWRGEVKLKCVCFFKLLF